MNAAEKAFWTMATIALIVTGCAHRALLPIPTIEIQETTNNLPPVWPSGDGRAVLPRSPDLSQTGEDVWASQQQRPTALLVSWTNPPLPQRWPGSSKRWPADWYFSGLIISTDLVTWAEYVRVAYDTNCSVPVVATSDAMYFRPFNGIKPTPRIE